MNPTRRRCARPSRWRRARRSPGHTPRAGGQARSRWLYNSPGMNPGWTCGKIRVAGAHCPTPNPKRQHLPLPCRLRPALANAFSQSMPRATDTALTAQSPTNLPVGLLLKLIHVFMPVIIHQQDQGTLHVLRVAYGVDGGGFHADLFKGFK